MAAITTPQEAGTLQPASGPPVRRGKRPDKGNERTATWRSFTRYVNMTGDEIRNATDIIRRGRRSVPSMVSAPGLAAGLKIASDVAEVVGKSQADLTEDDWKIVQAVVKFASRSTAKVEREKADIFQVLRGHQSTTWPATAQRIQDAIDKKEGVAKAIGVAGWDWDQGSDAQLTREALEDAGGYRVYRGPTWMVLHRLIELLPEHSRYVEVFPGHGIFWAKPRSKNEVLLEPDRDLALLYRYMRRVTDEDAEALAEMDWKGTPATFSKLAKESKDRGTVAEVVHRLLYLRRFGTRRTSDGWLTVDKAPTFNEAEEGATYEIAGLTTHLAKRLKRVRVRAGGLAGMQDSKDTLFLVNLTALDRDPRFDGRPEELDFDFSGMTGKVVILADDTGRKVANLDSSPWPEGKKGLRLTDLGNGFSIHTNYDPAEVGGSHTWSIGGDPPAAAKMVKQIQEPETAYPFEVQLLVQQTAEGPPLCFVESVLDGPGGTIALRKAIDVPLTDGDEPDLGTLRKECLFLSAPIGVFEEVEKLEYPDSLAGEVWGDTSYLGDDLSLHLRLTSVGDLPPPPPGALQDGSYLGTEYRTPLAKGMAVWGVQEPSSGLSEFFLEYDDDSLSSGRWVVRKRLGAFELGLPADQVPAAAEISKPEEIQTVVKALGGDGGDLGGIVVNDTTVSILRSVAYPFLPSEDGSPLQSSKFVKLLVEKKALEEDTPKEERFVYGVVLEPNSVDAHGDIISEDEIRRACHAFMETFGGQIGVMHRFQPHGLIVLETYVTPVDMDLAGETIKKGTWIIGARILNDAVWERVKLGVTSPDDPQAFTGFSVQGLATVEYLRQPGEDDARAVA